MLDENGSKDIFFTLKEDFLEKFKGQQPNWGPLGYISYKRTYARPKEGGSTEEYWETLKRVVEGTYTVQKRHCLKNLVPWSEKKAQNSAQKMFQLMWDFKFLPPGRGLWMMGTKYIYERGGMALNNCGFVSTENITTNFSEPFCFLMDACMLGVGVGGDTKGAGKLTIREPKTSKEPFVIPDTREGWVDALRMLLSAFSGEGELPSEFDYSLVRIYGEPIKGFGGTASGPGPLKDMIESIKALLSSRVGSKITSSDIVDIFNLIGRCVVAGNVRRTAEIMFGDPNDQEFLELKNPEKYKDELMHHRWASNNSIFATVGMDYSKVAEMTAKNGEPGYEWLDNARAFSRMGCKPDFKDYRAGGGNPCLAKGTMVQVIGEGPVPIEELASRDEPFYVYSMTEDGKLSINKAHAFLTKENAETLKLKFATGKEIICTPDHKIAIKRDGIVWIEARHLKIGDSGIAFQRIKKGYGYLRVKLSTENTYVPEHRKIFLEFNKQYGEEIDENHIHHKDDNPFNNKIGNLEMLSPSEHSKITNIGHKNYATQDELGRFSGSAKEPEWNKSVNAPEQLLTKNIAGGSTRLKAIEEGPMIDVYDLSVEKDHCFIANDMVVHNCLEQTLEPYELCTLVETFPVMHNSLEEWQETLKYAYLYAKTVTLIPTHNKYTNAVMLRNRRIGCSISGITQAFKKFGRRKFFNSLSDGYDRIGEWDKNFSEWMCIPRSIKTTSIKPSGTISLLPGVTPGIHYPISEYYIRNVRFMDGSPLLKALEKSNYPIEKDKYSDNTYVVSFPIKEEFFDRSVEDVSMWEQLENVAQIQEKWADNQVSVTVSFSKEEAKDIKYALELYETRLKGVSFLPKKDHGYEQAPYIPITKEKYEELNKTIKKFKYKNGHDVHDSSAVHEQDDKYCDGDACIISIEQPE